MPVVKGSGTAEDAYDIVDDNEDEYVQSDNSSEEESSEGKSEGVDEPEEDDGRERILGKLGCPEAWDDKIMMRGVTLGRYYMKTLITETNNFALMKDQDLFSVFHPLSKVSEKFPPVIDKWMFRTGDICLLIREVFDMKGMDDISNFNFFGSHLDGLIKTISVRKPS